MIDITEFEAMAMLDLPDDERELLTARLNALADGFTEIERFDTGEVEPLVTVLEMFSVLREDIPVKPLSREDILINAPDQHDGFFQVPATID